MLSLPAELLQRIGNDVNKEDVQSLRLTCKTLSRTLTRPLLHTISINLTAFTFEREVRKIRGLAKNASLASKHTRHLVVQSLSGKYHPDVPLKSLVYPEELVAAHNSDADEWETEVEAIEWPFVTQTMLDKAEAKLRNFLVPAIKALKNVKSVRWIPNAMDPPWAQARVHKALCMLSHLECVDFDLTFLNTSINYTALPPLRHLALTYDMGPQHKASMSNLHNATKAINRSPSLSTLSLCVKNCTVRTERSHRSLYDIFESYPENAAPLKLRSLQLEGYFLRLDDLSLPHFRHLTSLTILNIIDPYYQPYSCPSNGPGLDDFLSSDPEYAKLYKYGAGRRDFWATFAKELSGVVRLEKLVVDYVCDSLLTYLESYSGLKALRLDAEGFWNKESADEMATRFYSVSLQPHLDSLKELFVETPFEGGWCFNEDNQHIITSCKNLKRLRLCLISSEMVTVHFPTFWSDKKTGHVEILFKLARKHLHLDTLMISASNSESNRQDCCSMGWTAIHVRRANSNIRKAVEELGLILPENDVLFDIVVAKNDLYIPLRNPNFNYWRYHRVAGKEDEDSESESNYSDL